MTHIKVNIDTSAFVTLLQKLVQKCAQRQPLMQNIAMIMEAGVQDNFVQGGRPKWLGVKRGGTPLTQTGHLKNSMTTHSDNNSASVGTNVVYAAIHNFGGKTKPHVIRPRHKKALAFNGRVVKKVNHPGSKIPKREFMVITDAEKSEIERTIHRYLRGAL